MSNRLLWQLPILFSILLLLVWKVEHKAIIPAQKEKCMVCHSSVSSPSLSHPVKTFGCSSCHGGNPFTLDKKSAHYGIYNNPGDLEVVRYTCGQPKCHSDQVSRVSKSLMATNRGIISTLLARWEGEESFLDVSEIKTSGTRGLLSLDLYAKMCGGCHLWQKRNVRHGEMKMRGGGCSGCHIVSSVSEFKKGEKAYKHPLLSTAIPVQNCLRCHNRSARMGLSYIGVYESAGYGTPYESAGLNSRKLTGGRFYLNLPPDVHWEKHHMLCVDCHTGTGVMGDGKKYDFMEQQVDITCEACHRPKFSLVESRNTLAAKLAFLNRNIVSPLGQEVASTSKQTPIYNLQRKHGIVLYFQKTNGAKIDLPLMKVKEAYHSMKGHERLKCQACHSQWIPQCYGCHIRYVKRKKQRDWLWGKKSSGRWKEYRSYIRFSKPTLGIDSSGRIAPFSPCEVFFKGYENEQDTIPFVHASHLIMSSFDPHTTQKKSRTCFDCHADPKTMGLGEGILIRVRGEWKFRATFDSSRSGFSFSFPLDAFGDLIGKPLHEAYRKGARPFNKEELEDHILGIDSCQQ